MKPHSRTVLDKWLDVQLKEATSQYRRLRDATARRRKREDCPRTKDGHVLKGCGSIVGGRCAETVKDVVGLKDVYGYQTFQCAVCGELQLWRYGGEFLMKLTPKQFEKLNWFM